MMPIFYRDGYKYQLVEDYEYQLGPEFPDIIEIETDYLFVSDEKVLIVKKGYAWDGPSGPTIDTKNFMRASLVHDALYQLIREGYLDKNVCRILADKILYDSCRRDGMWWLRAKFVYHSVRVFGNPAARSTGKRPLLSAP